MFHNLFYLQYHISREFTRMEVDKTFSKVDLKELKRLKKGKKKVKETKLLAKLEQRKSLLEAAKPVPKNLLSVEALARDKGRRYTVSVAVPGSILDNAQTPELR